MNIRAGIPILVLLGASLLLAEAALSQGTPDGETPSQESVCNSLSGTAFGLCNAYCEAQDCDANPGQSCQQLRLRFQEVTGDALFPCDELPVTVDIETSPSELTIPVGETANFTTAISFSTEVDDSSTVLLEQSLSAPDGIALAPATISGFTTMEDFTKLINQEVTGLEAGVYSIDTVASIADSDQVASATTVVTVTTPGAAGPALENLGTYPGALEVDETAEVTFSVHATGQVDTVRVEETDGKVEPLLLNDTGEDPDLSAGDFIHTGRMELDPTGLAPGSCFSFRAVSSSASSGPTEVCVSELPVGTDTSVTMQQFEDTETGESFLADEVLVRFQAGTSQARKMQVAQQAGATIVGTLPSINLCQFRLSPVPAERDVLLDVIAQISSEPSVDYAVPNGLVGPAAVTPEDPKFKEDEQPGLTKVRADEAWTIAQGGPAIAVVDSGVDPRHPDLGTADCVVKENTQCGKVVIGRNFSPSDTPVDKNGHGTFVAGIAAAKTDNGRGIAGVAPQSNVLSVKVGNDQNGKAKSSAIADGIIYAANRGAPIINISMGASFPSLVRLFFSMEEVVCDAVFEARFDHNAVVVAAAGNESSSNEHYPAACPGAIAVGNTTLDDRRFRGSGGSNFGTWVDLAAPGQNVTSIFPSGTILRSAFSGNCDESGYCQLPNGFTSSTSPIVAAAAAMLYARAPHLTPGQIRFQLQRTAVSLTEEEQLGAGRLDIFEAVFDGSFEDHNLTLWNRAGSASSVTSLDVFSPRHRERIGHVSTGPADAQVAGSLSQEFTLQPGVVELPLQFEYAFVSEEFPEFVGTEFNDALTITLTTPSGEEVILAEESVNSSSFIAVSGIDFPGGDDTVGWTGWKRVCRRIPVESGDGQYELFLTDAGDRIYDTVTLIDGIAFRASSCD